MPTFLILQGGKVVDSLKGADPAGLTRLVKKHAAGRPSVPLGAEAEGEKSKGNVGPFAV